MCWFARAVTSGTTNTETGIALEAQSTGILSVGVCVWHLRHLL